MEKGIDMKTEQLALIVTRVLFDWQDAVRTGDTSICRQCEKTIFETVELHGLSKEWLELYARLNANKPDIQEDKEA
ncbi:hypothetical protein [Cohnella fermenti]|uniref:Uncharacterized protein n=1 Tax=Cohnella fermenti TaxID=2565925 RepID=A0A4S4BPB5_9BACL|nr:hypothetical protein [Cohnella fermenti]THF74397.1 hypothetical protein E6C55_25485 [Cohnella fermenti]